MILPQFSIRWLLGATAICAAVFSIIALAVRGHGWAIGVSVALGSLAVTAVLYALLSAVVGLFGLLVPAHSTRRAGSPFAAGTAEGAPPGGAAGNPGHSDPTAGAADATVAPSVQAEIVNPD